MDSADHGDHEGHHPTTEGPGHDPTQHGQDGHEGHPMSFHAGITETILFDFWKTNNTASLLGSIVLVFIMGVAYEALKYLREYLQMQHRQHKASYKSFQSATVTASSPTPTSSTPSMLLVPKPPRTQIFTTYHIAQTGLHFIQFILSYFLMLIFMTYNVWLCLGVATGATLGYFVFGWQREAVHDTTEHCH